MTLLLPVGIIVAGMALIFVPSVSLGVVDTQIVGVIGMLAGLGALNLALFLHTRERSGGGHRDQRE